MMKFNFKNFVKRNYFILAVIGLSAGITLGLMSIGCTKKNPESTGSGNSGESKVLHLYCWSNYFSPSLIKAFEEKHGAKVEFSYFSSNEELLAKLQAGAKGYDIIVPSGYLIKALKELYLIQPLTPDLSALNWPELKNLLPRTRAPAFDPQHVYTVPYMWGTGGLAVNKDKVKTKVDSWGWVFDMPEKTKELRGKISMLDDGPAVFSAALKYLGYPYNEKSPAAFEKVKKLLIKQKAWLKAYTSEFQPVLETGEVHIAQVYSGDTQQLAKRMPSIEYVFPKEGGEIFLDNLAIPKGANNPELAKEFMKFTLDQKVAAMQVEHLFYSPAVDVSAYITNPAVKNLKTVFPTDEDLKNYEFTNDDPERIEQIEKIWMELKSS